MYSVSVPISMDNIDRLDSKRLLESLKALDAKRVMLGLGVYQMQPQRRADLMERLRTWCDFFHQHGFEVCAWNWSFWIDPPHQYTPIHLLQAAAVVPHEVCPADRDFICFASDYLAQVAECGVDMILFDDDLRFSQLEGGHVGCLCDRHVEMINRRTGEDLSREELVERILAGGKNRYRDAWIDANGQSLESFARAVRASVDAVAPQVRIGFCACFSSWDLDGVGAKRLARLLAGEHTKPFIRLIGAPYWATKEHWGNQLQDVIELERMESSWTKDGDIEIVAEGDCYPRPRLHCPASYLELFDLAMRATGATDGILKYALDYVSGIDYEAGYVDFHKKNRALYGQVEAFFDEKTLYGVRIYEFAQKAADIELDGRTERERCLYMSFFSSAARSLAACSIPTTYEGDGVCGAAFGASARYLTDGMRKNGLIIDAEAALILHRQGIDVGICEEGRAYATAIEHFRSPDEYVSTEGMQIYAHVFSTNIQVCSEARVSERKEGLSHTEVLEENARLVPMSYLYENSNGERYLVLNFNTRYEGKHLSTSAMRHYARSRQYADAIPYLSRGKHLPAFCFGNPNLYTVVKKERGGMTVGLWNCFADPILTPRITLDGAYREIRTLNCEGHLDKNTVTLSEIPAYGFAAFAVN